MAAIPDSVGLVIAAGCLGAMAVALLIGALNGTGVAVFGVSPFIMTLGVQSVGAGVALFLTGGVPVSGFPHEFGDLFGFGRVFGVPVPVAIAIVAMRDVAIFAMAPASAAISTRSAATSRRRSSPASTPRRRC